jgi:hypothetical protein
MSKMQKEFVEASVKGAGYAVGAVVTYKVIDKGSEKIGNAVGWAYKKAATWWAGFRAPKTEEKKAA